jgi:hypothetical protein
LNRLETSVERIIREAIERGELDNLQGKGQPLDLRENPFEDPDLRTVHRLLRNAGFAPAWLEERKDIDAEFDHACSKLARAWHIYGTRSVPSVHCELERAVEEFRKQVAELNQRIEIYNLKAPGAVFQRSRINPDKSVLEICANH